MNKLENQPNDPARKQVFLAISYALLCIVVAVICNHYLIPYLNYMKAPDVSVHRLIKYAVIGALGMVVFQLVSRSQRG